MPERFTLNNKTYDIPDDKIGIFMSKYPNAVKTKPQASLFDIAKSMFMKGPFIGAGHPIESIGRKIGETVAEGTVPDLLTVPGLQRGAPPTVEKSKQASDVAKIGVSLLADPTVYLGPGGLKVFGKSRKAISGSRKVIGSVVSPIEQMSNLKIPIFGAANKTEDALELGSRLKGSEEGISKLKFLEGKFAKEFEAAKETADFNALAIIAHKKQLYREAREVAEGTGGATEFLAKQAKPLEKIAGAKPIVKELTANQKLLKALKEAKPLRGKQEQIYKEERGIKLGASLEEGKKVSGQEGFLAQRSKLRGEMTKVEFESLKGKIGQKDIDNLFDQVKTSTEISEWERFNAGAGLMKMFGEFGGTVPAKGELALLEKVFGKELAGELLKKQSAFKRFKEIGLDIANIPRSFMTSFDLSFGFRQGIFTLARHPALFAKNFSKQFKLFRSEKYYQEVLNEIRSRPNFETMQKSGLSFTELRDMTKREEAFMSSFAEKIPIAGPIVRASGRAFTGFADRLRADLFDYMLDYGKKMGVEIDKHFLTSSAEFINNATGRGNLPKSVEKVAVGLNAVFFSPRLMMSRVNLLNPYKYMKLHPTVRKEALKSLAGFAGMAMTVGGLAKLAGADVETDPRNADFMKIKTGNTRYDILGGFQQPVRAMAQIGSGKIISSTTGKEITLGEGYKPLTRLDVGLRFLAMKESPLFSFAHTMMEGVNAVGEKFDVSTEIANRFIPMVIQDMNDLYKEKGFKGIPMAAPAVFGVGVQSYGGVGSWGLSGNDYPSLNKELLRLKIPMGFPSMSVSGKELDLSEYKNLKDKTGKKIASELTGLIKSSEYGQYSTEQKKQIINKYIDRWKEIIKFQVYPEKFKK